VIGSTDTITPCSFFSNKSILLVGVVSCHKPSIANKLAPRPGKQKPTTPQIDPTIKAAGKTL